MQQHPTLGRRAAAELVGTALLLIGVVGSGIMADRLSPDNVGVALLAHALAVAGVLGAVILVLGRVSGAHLNPAVSLAVLIGRGMDRVEFGVYAAAQVTGGLIGVVFANLMFELPAVTVAMTPRTGPGVWLGEFIATAGLVLVVWGAVRREDEAAVAAIPLWVGAAIYFTSSNCFANPAVTVARTLTDTFTGIAPADAAVFLPIELVAAVLATLLARYLFHEPLPAEDVVIPHERETEPR